MKWTRSYDLDGIFRASSAYSDVWNFTIVHYGRRSFTLHAGRILDDKELHGAVSGRIDYTTHFKRLKDAKDEAERIASNRADCKN